MDWEKNFQHILFLVLFCFCLECLRPPFRPQHRLCTPRLEVAWGGRDVKSQCRDVRQTAVPRVEDARSRSGTPKRGCLNGVVPGHVPYFNCWTPFPDMPRGPCKFPHCVLVMDFQAIDPLRILPRAVGPPKYNP